MISEVIIQTIETYNMLSYHDKVTVALSGGADSVCLLFVLNELKDKYEFEINAVHVNHCIRGEEADSDETFCRKLCERLDIPLIIKKVDVPKISAEKKLSLEEAARNVRYKIFAEHSVNGKLATAHTASDNAETVILNLARGTGLKGMCGIPPVRDNIIRPLIGITRHDVEEYLDFLGQDYVMDSTNLSDDYTRNRIRHKIIPEILRINSGFFKTFCAELKIFSDENFFIEKLAKNAYNICIDNGALYGLEKYDAVIRKRCISYFLKEKELPISFDKINSIDRILLDGGKINISDGAYAVCRKGVLTIMIIPTGKETRHIKLHEGKNSIFDEKTLYAEIKNGGSGLIDTEKVCGEIMLHKRKNGDKIRLAGRNFTSSVKKLLNENIRADMRPYIHFLSDDKGLIFIEGIGIADRVKTDVNTKKSLCITIKDVK